MEKCPIIRVLLVDDDLAFTSFMREQLQADGFEVTAVTSGAAAVETFGRQPFDVLVTDLVLAPSDGSGLDLIKRLRKLNAALPVVVLTGFSSQSKNELLEANVPVVEKGVGALDVLAGVILDVVRPSPISVDRSPRLTARPDTLTIDQLRKVFAEEAQRLLKLKESTVVVPGERHVELPKAIQGFKKDIERRLIKFPYHQNVFLMMKFRESNRDVSRFIRETLRQHKLRGIRADAPEWNITQNLYNPIAVLHCCKYGIALFDRAETKTKQAFSANVAYELGMMHQQNKTCLVLKHSSLPPMPFDLIKDLYQPYNEDLQLKSVISRWISEISFEATGTEAQVPRDVTRHLGRRHRAFPSAETRSEVRLAGNDSCGIAREVL
jgi:CheY-like chemotaxis protein